jgi:hypothetical protein
MAEDIIHNVKRKRRRREMSYCGCFCRPTDTATPRYNGSGYKGQVIAAYNCELLEMLRH